MIELVWGNRKKTLDAATIRGGTVHRKKRKRSPIKTGVFYRWGFLRLSLSSRIEQRTERKIESKTDTNGDGLGYWQLITVKEKDIHDVTHAETLRGKQNSCRSIRKNRRYRNMKIILEWVLYLVAGCFGKYIPYKHCLSTMILETTKDADTNFHTFVTSALDRTVQPLPLLRLYVKNIVLYKVCLEICDAGCYWGSICIELFMSHWFYLKYSVSEDYPDFFRM